MGYSNSLCWMRFWSALGHQSTPPNPPSKGGRKHAAVAGCVSGSGACSSFLPTSFFLPPFRRGGRGGVLDTFLVSPLFGSDPGIAGPSIARPLRLFAAWLAKCNQARFQSRIAASASSSSSLRRQ